MPNATDPTGRPSPRRRTAVGVLLGALLVLAIFSGGYKWLGLRLSRSSQALAFEPYPEPAPPPLIPDAEKPHNIIVFVADGLGFAHLALAQGSGVVEPAWHEFAVRGWHDPRPSRGSITDSAASATAMATGRLTRNDRVGVDPDHQPIRNLFEAASAAGYRTGVVTDSYVWDATPAAFVTHTASRDDAADILEQLAGSQLEVLLGELEDVGEEGVPTWEDTEKVLRSRFRLLGSELEDPATDGERIPVAALFAEDAINDLSSTPNLPAMTAFATARLANDDAPFLLLVESEEVDSASHEWDADRAIRGMQAINETVTQILAFSRARGDTLVLFLSDHETGGLALGYEPESYPDLVPIWGSLDHTSVSVPLLADGPGADGFAQVERVWQVGAVLHDLIR